MDGAYPTDVQTGIRPRKPLTLVLCFDGTSNEFRNHNTNIVKLYSILKKDDPKSQLCYYQAGIGTYFQPGVVSPFFRVGARILDEALAWYLSEHIMDGYKFLMQNYHEGDSVCIFGFSRGAYTARALAGMLHKVGLLSKDNLEQIPFAYKLYKSSHHGAHRLAVRFKRAFSRDVPIEFLGVWDTVASVGILNRRTLPFVGANNMIRVFRQALALDECRAKFSPNLYHRSVTTEVRDPSHSKPLMERIGRTLKICKRIKRNPDTPPVDLHPKVFARHGRREGFEKDVKEVWFVGAHSDVGGGLAKDTDEHALSNIPLRWMVNEIVKAQCHIRFDETALGPCNIPISAIERVPGPVPVAREASDSTLRDEDMPDKPHASLAREVNASTSTSTSTPGHKGAAELPSAFPPIEESLDAMDALEKKGNAFKKNVLWWMLELVPTYHEWQNEDDEWIGRWRLNLGRGRHVPSHPLFHESVKIRMENPLLKYSPRAQYKKGTEEYVK